MTTENETVELRGNIHVLTLKGDGKGKTKLCLTAPDPDSLAALAKSPRSAKQMISGVLSAGGKAEIVTEGGRWNLKLDYQGKTIRNSIGVELKKIVFKKTDPSETNRVKPEAKAELHLTEEIGRDGVIAEYEHLGCDLEIKLIRQQAEMFGEGEGETPASEAAPKRRGRGSPGKKKSSTGAEPDFDGK